MLEKNVNLKKIEAGQTCPGLFRLNFQCLDCYRLSIGSPSYISLQLGYLGAGLIVMVTENICSGVSYLCMFLYTNS